MTVSSSTVQLGDSAETLLLSSHMTASGREACSFSSISSAVAMMIEVLDNARWKGDRRRIDFQAASHNGILLNGAGPSL